MDLGDFEARVQLSLFLDGFRLELLKPLEQLGNVLALEGHREAAVARPFVLRAVKHAAEGVDQRGRPVVSFVLIGGVWVDNVVAVEEALFVQDNREGQTVHRLECLDVEGRDQLLLFRSSWCFRNELSKARLTVDGRTAGGRLNLHKVFALKFFVLDE